MNASGEFTGSPFYRIAEIYLFDTCTLKCGYCRLAETGMVLKASELEPYRDPQYVDRVTDFFNTRTSNSQQWHLMRPEENRCSSARLPA